MDIIEQLRTAPIRLSNIGENAERLLLAAADEIERLRKLVQTMVLSSKEVHVRTINKDNGTTPSQ